MDKHEPTHRQHVTEQQVTDALSKWGKVEVNRLPDGTAIMWVLRPGDIVAFCDATDFGRTEAKYGMLNIVVHELFRIAMLFEDAKTS